MLCTAAVHGQSRETLQAGGSLVASPWIYWEFAFPVILICFMWFSEKGRNARWSRESLFGKGWSCLSLFLSSSLGMFGLCLNWLILYSPTTLLAVGKEKKKTWRKKKETLIGKPECSKQRRGEKKLCFYVIFKRKKTKPGEKKRCWDLPTMRTWICCDSKPIFSPCSSQPDHAQVWNRKAHIQVWCVSYMFREDGFCVWSRIRIIFRINKYICIFLRNCSIQTPVNCYFALIRERNIH